MVLILNICKMKVLHQPGLAFGANPLIIKVQGEALENIDHFQHLGSVLSAKAAIDEEIQHIQCASAAFGHLRKTVFEDNSIRSNTKLMVYR
eukprot:g37803.t1